MKNIFKIVFIALILLLSEEKLLAQDEKNQEQKIYTDENGRLIINKELPLYLWMTTSPEPDAKKYRLESEKNKKYSNPFYLDTEGKNTVRHYPIVDPETKKVVAYTDLIMELYADGLPPYSHVKFHDAKIFYSGGKKYFRPGLKIAISTWDAVSGTEKVYYSLNDSDFKEYNSPIELNQAGEIILKYYSVDKVGNTEPEKKIALSIAEN